MQTCKIEQFLQCGLAQRSDGQLIIPRFLTELDGVIADEPNWIVKSCCRVGVAGKTRSSVFARLSWRWCSFIHAEMSARQAAWDPCSYRWIIWSKWEIQLCEEPQWSVDVLWIPPLPRQPRKTDQWDRIQTSEVESQWCPVMRGWTGGSDNWQCQKQQIDPAEWGLMIWNRFL